jgi:hypothetical protein
MPNYCIIAIKNKEQLKILLGTKIFQYSPFSSILHNLKKIALVKYCTKGCVASPEALNYILGFALLEVEIISF